MPPIGDSVVACEVSTASPVFAKILSLWRENSRTLGFMPVGGFQQASYNGTLLSAENLNGDFLGYVLYRRSFGQLAIAHLCISTAARGKGVARFLTEQISSRHQDARGILLWCRRDFSANAIWQNLGFSAKGYRRGRGRDGGTLVLWFKDHGHEDLFSYKPPSTQVEATIDSCVLFDLLDESPGPEAEESKGLQAEWLQDSVKFLITPEVANDIQRDANDLRIKCRSSGKTAFTEIRASPEIFRKSQDEIETLLPSAIDEQTRSDYRHLAWSKSAKIPYFITRDARLLSFRRKIRDIGLEILSPGEFVSLIDQLERKEQYRPEILSGTHFSFVNIDAENIEKVTELADHVRGEKVRGLIAM